MLAAQVQCHMLVCSSVLSAFGIARQEGSLGTVKCSFDRLAIHL